MMEEKNEKRNDSFVPPDSNSERVIFFSSLNAISMSYSSKRATRNRTTKKNISESLNYYSNSSPRIYPRSYHFCLASAGTKGAEIRFDPESWHCGSFEISLRRTTETEEALPGASRSTFRHSAVSRVSFRIVVLLVDQRRRRRDRRRGDGRRGNVINFKRDFYCRREEGKEREGRWLELEFALTSDALSAVWKVSRPRESFTWSCNKRPWTGDKIERRNSAAKLQRIVSGEDRGPAANDSL